MYTNDFLETNGSQTYKHAIIKLLFKHLWNVKNELTIVRHEILPYLSNFTVLKYIII